MATGPGVVFVGPTQITAIAPAPDFGGHGGRAGADPDGQSDTLASSFLYEPPPSVYSVGLDYGPIAGGTSVATARASSPAPRSPSAASRRPGSPPTAPRQLRITTPAHSAGPVDVVVTNPDGQSGMFSGGFGSVSFLHREPGDAGGGTRTGGAAVTITGSRSVWPASRPSPSGGQPATSVVVVDPAHLTAQTPAHIAGAGGRGYRASWVSGTPLSSASRSSMRPRSAGDPSAGSGAGGTAVTLTGTNFFAGVLVSFGGVAATNVNVVSPSTLTAVTRPARQDSPVRLWSSPAPMRRPARSPVGPSSPPPPSVRAFRQAADRPRVDRPSALSRSQLQGRPMVYFGADLRPTASVRADPRLVVTSPPNTTGDVRW